VADVARDKSIRAISIELAENYYEVAKRRFFNYKNVEILCGDSGKLMPTIVTGLSSPALF